MYACLRSKHATGLRSHSSVYTGAVQRFSSTNVNTVNSSHPSITTQRDRPSFGDWRIVLGLCLTTVWLLLGIIYISQRLGWTSFTSLPPAELGSFFEGAFAPLAFLWLVIGYFLQQKELEQNTHALQAQAAEIQRTAEQAVIQSQKLAESEFHARQNTFLQIANSVHKQLGAIGGLLYMSSQSAQADGTVTSEEMSQLFRQLSAYDTEVFSRRILETYIQTEDPEIQHQLFYGTDVRARHSNNFIFTFERLLRRARELDKDDMIYDALQSSSHGFVYRIAKEQQQHAPEHLADHERTGRHINF